MLVNGSNPLLLLDELRGLGDCRVTVHCDRVPPLAEMEPDACYLEWEVVLDHGASAQRHRRRLHVRRRRHGAEGRGRRRRASAGRRPSRRRPPRRRPARRSPQAAASPAPAHAEHAGGAPETSAKRAGGVETSTIRVPAERLDEMMDRVGELVIAQARLTQLASAGGGTKGVAEEIERLTSALRDAMMGIRMVPIGSLFGRFRRLVHDLSRDLGKEIDLTTAGEETELDKTMIERLADPLVHLIRNAADHGLEDAETRVAAGKPRGGPHQPGRASRRRRSADQRQRRRPRPRRQAHPRQGRGKRPDRRRTPSLSDAELYQLIFQPGFSTAKEVSALSGRGVGLDVVKRTIEGMRGSIDIATQPGQGTDDHPAPAADAGDHRRPAGPRRRRALRHSADRGRGMRRALRGRRRRARRGAASSTFAASWCRSCACANCSTSRGEPDAHQKVVIVAAADTRVGLVVDQIIGSHQTVIKSLSKLHADVPSFSGATILGDGAVALILDVPHLIALGQAREARIKSSTPEFA